MHDKSPLMRALFFEVTGIAEHKNVGAEAPTYSEICRSVALAPTLPFLKQLPAMQPSIPHEQSHERVGADLTAPVAVDGGVERGAFGQGVARIEKLARTKDA